VHPFPDLMACETAAVLAEVIHLLGRELEGISCGILPRVLQACRRQVFDSFLANDSYGWLQGHNNWAPWCASSVILAACRIIAEPDLRYAVVRKAILVCTRFLDRLPEDGYGHEGPSYAYVAIRAMTYAAEMLHVVGSDVNFFEHAAFRRLCMAFVDVHLDDLTVANFGACSPTLRVQPAALQRLGERISSATALALAHRYAAVAESNAPRAVFTEVANAGSLLHMVRELIWVLPEQAAVARTGAPRDLVVEFPFSQVAILRERAMSPHGFTVAVRGGHNGVSHNHNDVGHFILTYEGSILIADVGRETYHRDSWGARRYEAWNLRGSGHNAPLVNGFEQQAGSAFAARGATLSHSATASSYFLDLAGIYPAEARVSEAWRRVELRRDRDVKCTVTDRVVVGTPQVQVELHLYSPREPRSEGATKLTWLGTGEHRALELLVHASDARVEVTRRDLVDPWLRDAWGTHLWHIRVFGSARGGIWDSRLEFCLAK